MTFDNWFAPGRYEVLGQRRATPAPRAASWPSRATPTSFVVTGTRAGGGIVDVPHAFSLFRAGRGGRSSCT